MRNKPRQITLSGLFVLFSCTLFAQGPPIFTGTPVMLGLEGRGLRTFGKYIAKENASAYVHPVAVPYNINQDLQVGGIFPYVRKDPEQDEVPARSGLGDIAAFFKHEVFQKDWEGKTLRGLVKIQETFPTGNTAEPPPLGSGEYQTRIGFVSGFVTTEYGLYTELGYNITSSTATETFTYDLAFGLPLLPQQWPPKQLNTYLELNGNYGLDSDQNTLFLSPGVQFIAGKRVLLETGVQYPLIEEVPEGMQTEFMYTLGTRILIF